MIIPGIIGGTEDGWRTTKSGKNVLFFFFALEWAIWRQEVITERWGKAERAREAGRQSQGRAGWGRQWKKTARARKIDGAKRGVGDRPRDRNERQVWDTRRGERQSETKTGGCGGRGKRGWLRPFRRVCAERVGTPESFVGEGAGGGGGTGTGLKRPKGGE